MAEKTTKTRGLGRGLSALMADVAPAEQSASRAGPDRAVPVERIRSNPDQPRRQFDPQALEELAASIREHGVIQPLIVRPIGDNFEIVAGERRWRASQMAQLHEVPVLVRDYNEEQMLQIAIIENIQRADLNPIDEAAGYRQLMDRFGHTQDQLASALGKSCSHIANSMRLLSLPDDVISFVTDGKLSAGHARTLVGHPAAAELARKIIRGGLSVRAAERLAREDKTPAKGGSSKPAKDADTILIEQELAATLGMGVAINHAPGGEGGSLTLKYKSLEQLDDLLRALSGG